MKANTPIRTFSIGGLKLSPELIQIRLFPDTGSLVTEMFRRLADQQVNLIGVVLDALDGQMTGVCYISIEDRLAAEQALQPFKGLYELQSPVGLLTIFPHQSRSELMGSLFAALGHAGLPVYGIASSLSSLTITTDYHRLDDAVSAVCQVVTLPDDHAPFRPEFRVKQL
ncbi:MAG: hypothetical protein HY787_16985 [Deltaproteobacteria bacterium]|nr:hypothetical protein [Deltaproteobacteria bacterium]